MKYAEILFPVKFDFAKETLTYSIPEDLDIKIGNIVEVEIKYRKKIGIVVDIHNKKPDFRTKEIEKIVFDDLSLNENQVNLLKWISNYYFCPLFKCLKLFIPKKLLSGKLPRKSKEKTEQIILSAHKELTEEQAICTTQILSSKENKFIIQGITGSGKTEIFVTLAKDYISKGRQVLMLVPEISLTPQTIDYFEKAMGTTPAVFHSKLNEGEKTNDYIAVLKGEKKLIIGSRSAIFSPFKDLGLIIIDEEHDSSYKQDSAPRYHAIKVAEKLSEISTNLKIVLGSATPSLETLEKFSSNIIHLKNRINNRALPEVEIVDLKDEFHRKNYSIFSERLKEELTFTFKNNLQALLFINRRGSASSVVCRDCGYICNCSNCDIPMTYHSKILAKQTLICHHCGKIENLPKICPKCSSVYIKFLGIGTERIEEELKKEFPGVRILRADKDTTTQKNGFKNIYDSFKKHEADVLIGTQMISKGLHLPLVNLVGIILADIGINIPDFRSNERAYQLLTQVSGRAGRGNESGKVIIQTYNPEHIALTSTKHNDFEGFLKYERTQRKILKNPPFSSLAKLTIENESANKSEKLSKEIEEILKKIKTENKMDSIEICAYPAYIYRLRNKFRNMILIKENNETTPQIHNLLEKMMKEYKLDANIKIDIDPLTIN